MVDWINNISGSDVVSIVSTVCMAVMSVVTSVIAAVAAIRSAKVHNAQARTEAMRAERIELYSEAIAAAEQCEMMMETKQDLYDLKNMSMHCNRAYLVADDALHDEILTMKAFIWDATAEGDPVRRQRARDQIEKVALLMRADIRRFEGK